MANVRSRISNAIRRDGAPGPVDTETINGASMDGTDRSSWPEINASDDDPFAPDNGSRRKGAQSGTTDGQ